MTKFIPSPDAPLWVQLMFWVPMVACVTWALTCTFWNRMEVSVPATAVALIILVPRLIN